MALTIILVVAHVDGLVRSLVDNVSGERGGVYVDGASTWTGGIDGDGAGHGAGRARPGKITGGIDDVNLVPVLRLVTGAIGAFGNVYVRVVRETIFACKFDDRLSVVVVVMLVVVEVREEVVTIGEVQVVVTSVMRSLDGKTGVVVMTRGGGRVRKENQEKRKRGSQNRRRGYSVNQSIRGERTTNPEYLCVYICMCVYVCAYKYM